MPKKSVPKKDPKKTGKSLEQKKEPPPPKAARLCEDCRGKIPEARLKALPDAKLCVSCQREREEEAKPMEQISASVLRGHPSMRI